MEIFVNESFDSGNTPEKVPKKEINVHWLNEAEFLTYQEFDDIFRLKNVGSDFMLNDNIIIETKTTLSPSRAFQAIGQLIYTEKVIGRKERKFDKRIYCKDLDDYSETSLAKYCMPFDIDVFIFDYDNENFKKLEFFE